MPSIATIPRSAVTTYLRVLRLPLDAAESVARRNADAHLPWGPSLAFDGFEAQVKELAGTVLRDDVLIEEATRQRAAVTQRRRAAELETEAEATRLQAERELDERREKAEKERARAEKQAQQQKARLEREKAEAEKRVREEAGAEKRKAREREQAEQKRIDERAREAEAAKLEQERKALTEKQGALQAKKATLTLDDAAEATKARRKAKKA